MSEALNREYLELCGWTEWRWFDDQGMQVPIATPPGQRRRVEPPKLHQDASACIAELDRVCKKNGWDLEIIHNFGAPEWEVEVGWISGKDIPQSWFGNGANFAEAALKCLIAAHKRESEAG